MASFQMPPNVHVSQHPCLRAKVSQLRSKSTNARDTKALIHQIALLVASEALASELVTSSSGTDETPLGLAYETETISPSHISLVPILRSGLGMVEALETLLPYPVPIHHLGLFRNPASLEPVEYYNNLPYHSPSRADPAGAGAAPHLAILLDPIIATGGTSSAAIQTLREWGVSKVVVMSVLGTEEGVRRAAAEWAEGVEIWVGALDQRLNERGMIVPGVGDVGDRLFGTKGK